MKTLAASDLAGLLGLLIFIGLFVSVSVYALWPNNRDKFDRAARSVIDDTYDGSPE